MLSSARFYLTLSARKFKTIGFLLNKLGDFDILSAKRAHRPSEWKVISDLQIFSSHYNTIGENFPCRLHLQLQCICRRCYISDLIKYFAQSCASASAVCIPKYRPESIILTIY